MHTNRTYCFKIRAPFCKIRASFFYFQKRVRETSLLHPASCTPGNSINVISTLFCQRWNIVDKCMSAQLSFLTKYQRWCVCWVRQGLTEVRIINVTRVVKIASFDPPKQAASVIFFRLLSFFFKYKVCYWCIRKFHHKIICISW